jgi:hypothetical protein
MCTQADWTVAGPRGDGSRLEQDRSLGSGYINNEGEAGGRSNEIDALLLYISTASEVTTALE